MRRLYICILIFTSFTHIVNGQDKSKIKNLETELKRLKTETVLIVYNQAIDDYPLWSPNSDYIAANIEGKWYKFRLFDIELDKAKWHGQKIGMLTTADAYSPLTSTEQKDYEKVSVFNAREVITQDSTKIELKETGDMKVSFIVTKKGQKPKTLWTTGGENCHSLILSPDGKYVAYLCELNGLLVMKIK